MATLVTRSGKGSPLTHAEVDANFTNLNTDKLELSGGTMTGNLSFGDNDKAIFGAGSDLEIYHDGTRSYIDENGTGDLWFRAENMFLRNMSNKNYLKGTSNAQVELFHNGLTKLATTSTGVDITGTLTTDQLTVYNGTSDPDVLFRNNGTGDVTLTFRRGAADDVYTDWSLINDNGTFTFRSDNSSDPDHTQLTMSQGDISFYEDTGTTAKFFWDASAERLGIGTTTVNYPLDVRKSSTTDYVSSSTSQATPYVNGDSVISLTNATSTTNRGAFLSLGSTDAWGVTNIKYLGVVSQTGSYGGNFVIGGRTASTAYSEHFRIDPTGNVGIGATSPASKLQVDDANNVRFSFTESGTGHAYLTVRAGYNTKDSQITFSNNTNSTTGSINYDHTSNFMKFSTNGNNERMRIDSSGRVMIGTTSSSSLFTVQSTGTSTAHIKTTATNGFAQMRFENDAKAYSIGVGSNDQLYFYDNTSSTNRILIDSSGNVGIGTSSPDTELHVEADTPVFRLTNPQSTSSLGLSMGKIEWETRDSSASGVIAHIDVVDSNNFGTTFDMAFATGQSGSATERMRIDSSGNVGIGTTSPSDMNAAAYRLVVGDGAGDEGLTIYSGTANNGAIHFADGNVGTAEYSGWLQYQHSINAMRFGTSSTEAMRIDSSGNLLVGTTSGSLAYTTNAGAAIYPDGSHANSRDGGIAGYYNRITSVGDIVVFNKNGSTVGSIAARTGDLAIMAAANYGIKLYDSTVIDDIVHPISTTGGDYDNQVNLGYSASRFKDLYLSGGVYLGGVGAANKLDDYEEGTWTPALYIGGSTTGVTYEQREGFYIKVGQQVFVNLRVSLTSKGSLIGTASILGLPFSVADSFASIAFEYGGTWDNWSNLAVATTPRWYLNQSTGAIILLNEDTTAGGNSWDDPLTNSDINNTTDIRISFTYKST